MPLANVVHEASISIDLLISLATRFIGWLLMANPQSKDWGFVVVGD